MQCQSYQYIKVPMNNILLNLKYAYISLWGGQSSEANMYIERNENP